MDLFVDFSFAQTNQQQNRIHQRQIRWPENRQLNQKMALNELMSSIHDEVYLKQLRDLFNYYDQN
jgi:hypothetical protein